MSRWSFFLSGGSNLKADKNFFFQILTNRKFSDPKGKAPLRATGEGGIFAQTESFYLSLRQVVTLLLD